METSLVIPRKRTGLHVREIEGETVVLDAENDRMHNLNATAAFIFDEIDGRRSVKEIGEDLASCFEIALERAAEDTRCLVAQLRELKLIV
jgi:hypothetical protein